MSVTKKVFRIVETENPQSGYAKGVVISNVGREYIIPFDTTTFSMSDLKEIWDNRESYKAGDAEIEFFSMFGEVVKITPNPHYVKPVSDRVDLRDVRKVFDQIGIIL